MSKREYRKFDRGLSRFRDDMAYASMTLNNGVPRCLAMLEALHAAFLLYYDNMSEQDQRAMREAFDRLADTVETAISEPPDNVRVLKK